VPDHLVTAQVQLDALIHAAHARDWNAARAAVEALVASLPADAAIALARAEVVRRLPAFEAHHPGSAWPRSYLEGEPGVEAIVEDEWPGPGGNNFASAIAHLDDAVHATDAARPAHVVDAIASAIMAEISAAWGARFPERWRGWYDTALLADGSADWRVLFDMRDDPDRRERFVAAWLAVADAIAASLTSA
jgi:hypothetical protein